MTAPRITVLMPVHNGDLFLRPAIDSILNQTYRDFRLLVIDDGSTDASRLIALSYDDPRVEVIVNETNINRARSLNNALDAATTEYVARMDADDIAAPGRLSAQVRLLDARPDIGICGTWIQTFGSDVKSTTWRLPTNPTEIAARLLFHCVLAHPTVMMRTAALDRHALRYDEEHLWAEDWSLWQRCSEHFPMANVPEALLHYRVKNTNERRGEPGLDTRVERRRHELREIVLTALKRLGIEGTHDEAELHLRIGSHDFRRQETMIDRTESWLLRLKEANDSVPQHPSISFDSVLRDYWFHTCYGFSHLGPAVLGRYLSSPLADPRTVALRSWAKFAVRLVQRRGL